MLTFQNLSFSYTSTPFINNINLHIKSGEYVGIIGPNGSGKSTLIKLMAGLLIAKQGTVLIDNEDIIQMGRRDIARRLAYVPQNIFPLPGFSVRSVVAMGRYPYEKGILGLDSKGSIVIDKALAQTGLQELQNRDFNSMSGGEQQRAIIASALAQEADLLLLDEPTSALDIRHQQEIYKLLRVLSEEEGRTVVVVTHDINLAAQFCSRIIMMDRGRIAASGTPNSVLQFKRIEQVYGVQVYIDINPFTKSVYILPFDEQSPPVSKTE